MLRGQLVINYNGIARMNDVGRPTKMCPKIRAKIIDAILHNLPYEMAAWSARIDESTLYDWINRGIKDRENGNNDSEFAKFSKDIKEAEMTKVKSHIAALEDQTERWQARAWLLERRWRKQFTADSVEIEMRERLEKLEKSQKDNSNG